jgi:hypothetical protein
VPVSRCHCTVIDRVTLGSSLNAAATTATTTATACPANINAWFLPLFHCVFLELSGFDADGELASITKRVAAAGMARCRKGLRGGVRIQKQLYRLFLTPSGMITSDSLYCSMDGQVGLRHARSKVRKLAAAQQGTHVRELLMHK